MVQKVDLGVASHEVFANPAPLGLLGLAIATSALTPFAFGFISPLGYQVTFIQIAIYAFLFGFGCQILTGIMDFANKNLFGGTIFTAFSFLWAKNALVFYAAAHGIVTDPYVDLATDITLLFIFAVLTYGFGFFSKLLFIFLLDIDLIFVCKVLQHTTHIPWMDKFVAVFTLFMGIIALWIAMAALINPTAGKVIFPISGPIFFAPKKEKFDWSTRFHIFSALYEQWREKAFEELSVEELKAKLQGKLKTENFLPDLWYLWEFGYLHLTLSESKKEILGIRLNAQGIDLHEQLVLKKYQF